jgi:hypothetical protein
MQCLSEFERMKSGAISGQIYNGSPGFTFSFLNHHNDDEHDDGRIHRMVCHVELIR